MRWLDGITDSWTWVGANSGRWWRTGKPGVRQAQGRKSQPRLSNWTTATCPLLGPEHQTRYQLSKRLQQKELFQMGNASMHSLLRPELLRCGTNWHFGPNSSLLRETVLSICTVFHNAPGLSMPITPQPLPELRKQKCLQASANASWSKLKGRQWYWSNSGMWVCFQPKPILSSCHSEPSSKTTEAEQQESSLTLR